MNLNPSDQRAKMPLPEGRCGSSRSRRTHRPITLYYGFVSVFFGLGTLVAFGSGSSAMGFVYTVLLVFFLLLPKLVRRLRDELVNRAPQSGGTMPQSVGTTSQYGSIPQRPTWLTGMRYDPGVYGYQPGLVPGDTMLPTAAQNEARNMYGNGS